MAKGPNLVGSRTLEALKHLGVCSLTDLQLRLQVIREQRYCECKYLLKLGRHHTGHLLRLWRNTARRPRALPKPYLLVLGAKISCCQHSQVDLLRLAAKR